MLKKYEAFFAFAITRGYAGKWFGKWVPRLKAVVVRHETKPRFALPVGVECGTLEQLRRILHKEVNRVVDEAKVVWPE